MKNPPSQAENHVDDNFILPFLTSPTSGLISLFDHEISTEQAVQLRDRLTELINCNVATQVAKSSPLIRETWWDTAKDPKVFNVEVDQTVFTDLQRLSKIGDNFEKTLLELILFYADRDALNIQLMPDVMESRTSYTRYTAQLGHALTQAQEAFPFIRVQSRNGCLGVFCRKDSTGAPKKSFMDSLIATLQSSPTHSVVLLWKDLPKSYKTNFALLKHQLKQSLTDQDVSVKKSEHAVNISINPQKSS